MEYLIWAQTVFYAVFSFALILFSLVFIIAIWHLAKIARHLRHIALNADRVSEEVKEKIVEIMESLSHLPFISPLLGKGQHNHGGRKVKTK